MWPCRQTVLTGVKTSDINDRIAAGELVESTRLLVADGVSGTMALSLLGACVAATGGTQGTFFTVGEQMHTLMTAVGIPVVSAFSGEIGGEPARLGYIPPPREFLLLDEGLRSLLSAGAAAVDPTLARSLNFYQEPRRLEISTFERRR